MKPLMITAAVLTFLATAALAQNEAASPATGVGMTEGADLSALPQVCRDAVAGSAATDATASTTDTTAGAATDSTDTAQMGSGMGGMMARGGAMGPEIDMMHGRMAGLQGIQDQDLAFACTMIAHHQGAVNMARAMESRLQDDEMKSMLATMIAAQDSDIARLTAWAEGHTPN